MPMPTPIPLPENFPVTWDDPMESMLLWEQEQLHLPHAVTPLGGELAMMALGPNITAGLHDLGAPVEWVKFKVINGYIYSGAMPNFALIEGAEERVKAVVGERGFTMYDRWLDTYLPEIEAGSAEVLSWDLAAASNEALGRYVERTIELLVRAFYIHFQLFPGFYTASAFADACKGMLGISDLEAFEMIQGAENLSVTSGSKLWRLAHGAPLAVQAVIRGAGNSTEALTALGASGEGQAFLADLDAYLSEFGWRTGSFDVAQPSWVDRPDFALDQLKLMLDVKSDPDEDRQRGAERAAARIAEAREKLAGNPEALGTFNFLLSGAKDYTKLQENHNFYLDQKFVAVARRPMAEVGRRMAAAGVTGADDDVFFVTLDDVRAFLGGSSSALHEKVRQARADHAYWAGIRPPLAIGARPPVANADPFNSRFFGASVVMESADERVLQGTPSSRGSVTAVARVIHTLDEAEKLNEGDIMVCDMTTPAWTPLFAIVSAVISDSGGALSHCAVVAREFGIPCVTGVRIATSTVPDGATVTVDGEAGTVTIH